MTELMIDAEIRKRVVAMDRDVDGHHLYQNGHETHDVDGTIQGSLRKSATKVDDVLFHLVCYAELQKKVFISRLSENSNLVTRYVTSESPSNQRMKKAGDHV